MLRVLQYIVIFTSLRVTSCHPGHFFKSGRFAKPGRAGPWVTATKGGVWPKPQFVRQETQRFMIVAAATFKFEVNETSVM